MTAVVRNNAQYDGKDRNENKNGEERGQPRNEYPDKVYPRVFAQDVDRLQQAEGRRRPDKAPENAAERDDKTFFSSGIGTKRYSLFERDAENDEHGDRKQVVSASEYTPEAFSADRFKPVLSRFSALNGVMESENGKRADDINDRRIYHVERRQIVRRGQDRVFRPRQKFPDHRFSQLRKKWLLLYIIHYFTGSVKRFREKNVIVCGY